MTDSNLQDRTPPHGTPAVPSESKTPPSGIQRPVTGTVPPVTGTQPPVTGTVPPVAVEAEGGGCGCVLPALVTGFVVTVLVLVGLFLPPFNLLDRLTGTQYAMLSPDGNAAQIQGVSLAVDPAQLTTGDFGVQLASTTLGDFVAGNAAAGAWIPAALASVPPYLALQSDVYTVATTGTPPASVTLALDIPATAGSPDLLDMYAYDDETSTWRFVPVQKFGAQVTATLAVIPDRVALFQAAPPDQPLVLVAADVTQQIRGDAAGLATIVAPGGMQPSANGTLIGSLAPGFDTGAGYRVMPVVRNFIDRRAIDPQTVAALLSSPALRAEHVRQVTALAQNFDGVFIDYRGLSADQRANFSAFVRELGAVFDRANLLLGVVVPSATIVADTWDTGAYDWRAIGAAADYVQINLTDNPASYRPGANQPVEAMLRWAVGEISRYKLMIGMTVLSVREVAGTTTLIGYDQALSALGDVVVDAQTTAAGTVNPGTQITARLDGFAAQAGLDTLVQSPFIDYSDGGNTVARMWLTTGDALRFRMDRTIPFALGGVAFEDLLSDGVADGVLTAITNYKLGIPGTPPQSDIQLRWRIEGSAGLLAEVFTDLNQPLVTTIDAPDGNYAINVDVVASGEISARTGAAVAVFAPTPTPTPLPTATPTPTFTPTFTPAPIIPTQAAAAPSGGGGPAAAIVAGSIQVGNFEYGGHVQTFDGRAINAMRAAGMVWAKKQLRYTRGNDPSVAQPLIDAARGAGFKILLGIVGNPGELAADPGGYMRDYAAFVAGVAARAPDAIEVWNEPNLDREWPTGMISGAMYVDLLRQAYQAIKSANGGVLVISGAPAPTGAEGAFPGRVMNDDRWLGEVVAAGGLGYMDCLGAHYNEGIVGPDATSGGQDGYYTRYFTPLLDVYWGIIGGQKPICFTELGYLTPEGYPPLDPFFGWAANTTVSQQASWLARALALSSQSGRVRLVIIWNVDFTRYDTDPMAGYAMIRPDGNCPACIAISSSR